MARKHHKRHEGVRKAGRGEPARSEVSLEKVFANVEKIRKRIKRRPKSMTLKSLIAEGRE